jgi:diacylglycerol kinase (ATP)
MKNEKAAPSPYQRTGFLRILYAFKWSYQGLNSACRIETAFRQELCVAIPLLAFAAYLDIGALEKAVLVLSTLLVLIVEILNSALETLADRISTDYDRNLGRVKDYGSAAVFLAILAAGLCWSFIIFDRFF